MTPGRMIVAALVLPALVLTGAAGAVGVVVAVRRRGGAARAR